MKLIIAGSRHLTVEYDDLANIIGQLLGSLGVVTEVVSGGAAGIDRSGENMAEAYEIPLKRFKADWARYGKAAGSKRNLQMAEYGDVLLLIWDGASKGSANMKARMLGAKKPVYEVIRK